MTVIANARHEAGSNLLKFAILRFYQLSVCFQIATPSFVGLAMTLLSSVIANARNEAGSNLSKVPMTVIAIREARSGKQSVEISITSF